MNWEVIGHTGATPLTENRMCNQGAITPGTFLPRAALICAEVGVLKSASRSWIDLRINLARPGRPAAGKNAHGIGRPSRRQAAWDTTDLPGSLEYHHLPRPARPDTDGQPVEILAPGHASSQTIGSVLVEAVFSLSGAGMAQCGHVFTHHVQHLELNGTARGSDHRESTLAPREGNAD
jgi:hypothetical protein